MKIINNLAKSVCLILITTITASCNNVAENKNITSQPSSSSSASVSISSSSKSSSSSASVSTSAGSESISSTSVGKSSVHKANSSANVNSNVNLQIKINADDIESIDVFDPSIVLFKSITAQKAKTNFDETIQFLNSLPIDTNNATQVLIKDIKYDIRIDVIYINEKEKAFYLNSNSNSIIINSDNMGNSAVKYSLTSSINDNIKKYQSFVTSVDGIKKEPSDLAKELSAYTNADFKDIFVCDYRTGKGKYINAATTEITFDETLNFLKAVSANAGSAIEVPALGNKLDNATKVFVRLNNDKTIYCLLNENYVLMRQSDMNNTLKYSLSSDYSNIIAKIQSFVKNSSTKYDSTRTFI